MFDQDLNVPEEQTPSVSTPATTNTPAASTPIPNTPSLSSSGYGNVLAGSTPAMTPAYTPAGGPMFPEEEGAGVEGDEEEEGGEEDESEIIKRFTMQNPFNPSNAQNALGGALGGRVMSWAESAQTPAADPSTPSLASSKVVGVDTGSTVSAVPNDVVPSSPVKGDDLLSQIALWKTKLGASTPIIHNVVATANLEVQLDLKTIALTARNAEYNPRRFAAVIMRIREPKATALVFRSGKIVVTGTRSAEEAKLAARKFGRVIMKVGYPDARFKDFKVENLVSTFTVPFPIHLEQLYRDLPPTMHSQYEPEVFPGLIFKGRTGTLLIFVSGKCVMIGMKTQYDIDKAYCDIMPLLDKHRKK